MTTTNNTSKKDGPMGCIVCRTIVPGTTAVCSDICDAAVRQALELIEHSDPGQPKRAKALALGGIARALKRGISLDDEGTVVYDIEHTWSKLLTTQATDLSLAEFKEAMDDKTGLN